MGTIDRRPISKHGKRMGRPPTGVPNKVNFITSINPELRDRLREIAQERDTTMSALLESWIRRLKS